MKAHFGAPGRALYQPLIDLAIAEDIGSGDITSLAIFPPGHRSAAEIISKDDGIFCGGETAVWVYETIDSSVQVKVLIPDGSRISRGDRAVEISGPTASILSGERISLNFMQRMSGISTAASRLMSIIEGTGVKILDTRKTLPGYRQIDKYCVKMGGGTNHRMGLYDMVMIKDNHIAAAGSISAAVARVRERWGSEYPVEVETTTLDQVSQALEASADIIMLDNMASGTISEAIKLVAGRAKTEISGNVNSERLAALASLGPDYISIGAITHSAAAFDLSMKFKLGE